MTSFYQRSGSGESLTLIHGVGAALGAWDGVIEGLGSGFDILRYDLRGHGRSASPPPPYQLTDFVDDLRELLDREAIDKTTIVGFSFGGLIGPAFALAYPKRISRLIILSAVCGRTDAERKAARARADAMAEGGANRTIDAALERWFTPAFAAAHPDVIETRRRQALENDGPGYTAAYRVFCESDLAGEVNRLNCATLVATGEDDPGSNVRMARFMHAAIPGSRLEIFSGLRHSILAEAPQVVAQAMLRFMS